MGSQSLSGKTALITGAAKRLGRATALALAHRGANIIIHYHTSANQAHHLHSSLADLGVQS